eukprot:9036860-Karenia_brevis.AAC.1
MSADVNMCHGRAIFDQKSRHDGKICPELRESLKWWKKVLSIDLAELHGWNDKSRGDPVHVFCDAAACPPHL